MVAYGLGLEKPDNISCFGKVWTEKERGIGALLFSFGTVPDPFSICPDSHSRALDIVRRMIQDSADHFAVEDGGSDVRLAAMRLSDCLQEANTRVRKLGQFLGHGIYIGGVITYLAGSQYVVITFGGASAYLWDGAKLTLLNEEPTRPYVTDALGCQLFWKGREQIGELAEKTSVISATHPFMDIPACEKTLSIKALSGSHPNTNSMMLNRILEKQGHRQTAVAELTR